jgi:hypothetical protein
MVQTAKANVTITINKDQAIDLIHGLDLYMRLSAGQIEEVAHVAGWFTKGATNLAKEEEVFYAVKSALGHPRNGNYGIAHENVHIAAKRAYEVSCMLRMAIHQIKMRDPNLSLDDRKHSSWSRDADGLTFRVTSDPVPKINLIETADPAKPRIQLGLDIQQVYAVSMAVNVYARIMSGNLQTIGDMVQNEQIKPRDAHQSDAVAAKIYGILSALSNGTGGWVPALPDAGYLIAVCNTDLPLIVQRMGSVSV